MPEGIAHARSSKHPSTQFFQFEPKREQKDGLNSASEVDVNPGFSPVSRWMAAAFEHDDFTSVADGNNSRVEFQVPENTIVLRAMLRIDKALDNASGATLGDADDNDGWITATSIESTGVKYTYNAAYQPAGTTGVRHYTSGGRIRLDTNEHPAPTEGAGLILVEVISYHEEYEAET